MDWIQQYWVEVLFAAMISVCGAGMRHVYKAVRAIKNGMQAILRDEIIGLYNKCHDGDCVKIYELENMEHLYKNYAALGGNGAIKELYADFMELPVHRGNEGGREAHNENKREETGRGR